MLTELLSRSFQWRFTQNSPKNEYFFLHLLTLMSFQKPIVLHENDKNHHKSHPHDVISEYW